MTDHESLIASFRLLKRRAGQSPGRDQFTYGDFSNSEAAEFMRQLSACIAQGDYHPEPTRSVEVPKAGGQGTRTLQIANIRDRVVATSINLAVAPIWERMFCDCSFGFRRKRSAMDLLASLELEMASTGNWVLAVDDVRDAFDNVPVAEVMALHEEIIDDRRLLALIAEQLQMRPAGVQHSGVGIPQGNAYSATALNVLLHYHLDAKLAATSEELPYFRYADNLVFACRTVAEGIQAIERAGVLLKPLGMQLKGKDDVVDLAAGEETQLLGFTVAEQGEALSPSLGKDAIDELHEVFSDAHNKSEPGETARYALLGWVDAHGIALKASQLSGEDLLGIAAEHGFCEIGSADELEIRRRASCRRWSKALKRASERRDELRRT